MESKKIQLRMQSLVFCGKAAFSFRAHTNTTQAQYTIQDCLKPEPVANTEKETDGNEKSALQKKNHKVEKSPLPPLAEEVSQAEPLVYDEESEEIWAAMLNEQRSPVMLEPVFGMCHNWSDADC